MLAEVFTTTSCAFVNMRDPCAPSATSGDSSLPLVSKCWETYHDPTNIGNCRSPAPTPPPIADPRHRVHIPSRRYNPPRRRPQIPATVPLRQGCDATARELHGLAGTA